MVDNATTALDFLGEYKAPRVKEARRCGLRDTSVKLIAVYVVYTLWSLIGVRPHLDGVRRTPEENCQSSWLDFFFTVRLYVRLYNICARCMRVRGFEDGCVCVCPFVFGGYMYALSPHTP